MKNKHIKPSPIQINWGERSSGLMKQKIALKTKKQINGKLNNIGSAAVISSPVRS
jgi:hypothetical protein